VCLLQLYIPWNYHERYPGEYTWDGMADVFSFIELIQELEMVVLLRVGPYICAEWDFGGLPWWLGSSQVRVSIKSSLWQHWKDFPFCFFWVWGVGAVVTHQSSWLESTGGHGLWQTKLAFWLVCLHITAVKQPSWHLCSDGHACFQLHFWLLTVSYLSSCKAQNVHQQAAQAVGELMSVELLPSHADD